MSSPRKSNRQLGIYFSFDSICVAETEKGKLVNYYNLPVPQASSTAPLRIGMAGEEDNRLVALIQKALLDSAIETKESVLALPARDMVTRFFEIPLIPKDEIPAAVSFEAKKYIPFKIEDVYADYLISADKKAQKIKVVYSAMRKDTVERYLAILTQSGLNAVALEPAYFSLLRVVKLARQIQPKIIQGIIDTNMIEGNITFIGQEIPLFTRDVKFPLPSGQTEDEKLQDLQGKLVNEINLSMDYFRRQSGGKKVEKVVFIPDKMTSRWTETLSAELGFEVAALQSKDMPNLKDLGPGIIKAFGASLKKTVSLVEINLCKVEKTQKTFSGLSVPGIPDLASSLSSLGGLLAIPRKQLRRALIMSVGLVGVFYLFFTRQILEERKKLQQSEAALPSIPGVARNLSLNELQDVKVTYEDRLNKVKSIVKRNFLTPEFNALPRILPAGIWLTSLNFDERANVFIMKGRVYLGKETEEMTTLDGFVSTLKQNEDFSKTFSDISLVNVVRTTVDGYEVVDFEIHCKQGG